MIRVAVIGDSTVVASMGPPSGSIGPIPEISVAIFRRDRARLIHFGGAASGFARDWARGRRRGPTPVLRSGTSPSDLRVAARGRDGAGRPIPRSRRQPNASRLTELGRMV